MYFFYLLSLSPNCDFIKETLKDRILLKKSSILIYFYKIEIRTNMLRLDTINIYNLININRTWEIEIVLKVFWFTAGIEELWIRWHILK